MIGTWRIGMVLGLAILGNAAVAKAQGVGSPDLGSSATTQDESSPADSVGGATSAEKAGSSLNLRGGTPAASRVGGSYNRVATRSREMVSMSSRPSAGLRGNTAAAARDPRGKSLHPYSARAKERPPEVPKGSTRQTGPRQPRNQPVIVRSMPHNYYPSIRTGQNVNANTAQVSRARKGMMPGIGVPSSGQGLAGSGRGR